MTAPTPLRRRGGRHGTQAEPWPGLRASVALSVAASGVVYVLYFVLGTGFVLDDWFTLRNARFSGAWAAAGTAQHTARPGAAVVYMVVFGWIGQHPAWTLAVQAAIGMATAGVLVHLLRRWLPPGLALLATLLWILLPNHTSLEVWASATNIALCVLLTVVGADLLWARARWGWWTAIGCFVIAALSYEAVIPLAAALVVVVPWVRRRRPDWRLVGLGALALGAVSAWIVVHWQPAKQVAKGWADLTQVVGAHFGWGVVPAGPVASMLVLVALVGMAVAVARVARPAWRSSVGPAEWAVVVGLAVIVLGVIPFAKYLYAPLGAGDRFDFASSIGGALVWTGVLAMAWSWRRPLAVVVGAALVVGAGVSRVQRSVIWHDAGHDARAVQAGVVAAIPHPHGVVVLGPAPIQDQDIAAFLDQSNVSGALQLAYDDPHLLAGLTFSQHQFDAYPASQRFDLRQVSWLHPDVVVRPG